MPSDTRPMVRPRLDTRAGEVQPLRSDRQTLAGPDCGGAMDVQQTVPKLGALPELEAFVCLRCGRVEVREQATA